MALKKSYYYTYLVRFGKVFLWLLATGVIVLVAWIGSGNNADNGGRMVFTSIPKSEQLQNIMKKPVYQGIDDHNRPYTVTADSGVQQDKDTVILDKIHAETIGDANAHMSLDAAAGVLKNNEKLMELTGGVTVFYEGGYEFHTDHAHVDIGEGSAVGDSPIDGKGPTGTIKSKRFDISERGNIIRFYGDVETILYQ